MVQQCRDNARSETARGTHSFRQWKDRRKKRKRRRRKERGEGKKEERRKRREQKVGRHDPEGA